MFLKKMYFYFDDIFDEGDTLDYLKNISYQKRIIFYFCNFTKENKKRVINIEPDYYCFDVDDKYFFGFGMDYKGFYRNLQDIYYVE